MGYVNEPIGVTLTVDNKQLTKEDEERLSNFIKKSKQKNKDLIKSLSLNEVTDTN